MSINLDQANAAVVVTRVLQGLHKPHGRGPYSPDDVLAACETLAAAASKRLLLTIPVSRPAVVQTLDHLAELDDETSG